MLQFCRTEPEDALMQWEADSCVHDGEGGTYIQPITELHNALDGDLDGADVGQRITLEVIATTNEEYNALPEFAGH